jgi:RimJ/RimL family protein N-acetyltransferase
LTYEIGYIFNKKYQGKGYATEAVQKFIEHHFSGPKIHKIIAHCNPKNEKSWKLLERLNFKREGELRKNIYFKKDKNNNPIWLDTYEYGLLKEDLK